MVEFDGFRTLALVRLGIGKPDPEELERRERSDESPRLTLFEKSIHAHLLDERFLARVGGIRGRAYRLLPAPWPQLLEGYRLRNRYDAVVCWAEHLGIPMAAMFKITGQRPPHVAIFSRITRPKKSALLRLVWSHFDKIILMSSVQYEAAIREIGISPERLVLLRWPVDQNFWRPVPGASDMICSVGREMRDYATLLEAMRGISIRCHIAANAVPGVKDPWLRVLARTSSLPPNVTSEKLAYKELRQLYARSRFVVIPLFPTDTDNGTTTVLEAMAMGKAVICSRVDGQRDVVQEGKTGLFVPPQDPRALREAIEHLWANPEKADAMGRAGREWIEKNHVLDRWAEQVREVILDVIRNRKQATHA